MERIDESPAVCADVLRRLIESHVFEGHAPPPSLQLATLVTATRLPPTHSYHAGFDGEQLIAGEDKRGAVVAAVERWLRAAGVKEITERLRRIPRDTGPMKSTWLWGEELDLTPPPESNIT